MLSLSMPNVYPLPLPMYIHRFVKLHVELPINVIRIEAPQKAECYRFDITVCDMCIN